tara:strand:- start:34 stop:849 length:816 start_codon:yes stop_codon:yes gene_type:complete
MIEGEDWPFTLDMPFSECYNAGDECPFDPDNTDSPCNAQQCADHESQECYEYVDNYCANNDDPGCGGDCPFSSEDYCYEYRPYCDPESPDYDPVYCGEGTAHYCLEEGSDDEGCTWLVDACAAGQESEELCNAFENFDHELYHADDFPLITLLGENVLTLTQSSDMNYVDAGASCFDAQDGDITNNIEVHGAVVNYNNEGSYTIFYDCTDSDGNHATTQSRTVIVQADPNTDDNGNVTEKEIKAEEVASISLIPVLISIGLLTIVRRRFNR